MKYSYSAFIFTLALSVFANARTQPSSTSPLFADSSVVQLQLTVDLEAIYKGKRDRPKLFVTLRDLARPGQMIKAHINVRGQSSLFDSEFPKLKLEIDDTEDLKGTIFRGAKSFKINTHVENKPTTTYTRMGRVIGDRAPIREALAYKLAEAFGLNVPATRLASIRYEDSVTKQTMTHYALLIETDGSIAKRIGAKKVPAEERVDVGLSSTLNPSDLSLFLLFHAMIGNMDAGLFEYKPTPENKNYGIYYRNAIVFELPNKKLVPYVYDFDLGYMVGGDRYFLGDRKTEPIISKEQQVQPLVDRVDRLKQLLAIDQIKQSVVIAKTKQAALYKVVKTDRLLDPAGRELALLHLDMFFKYIDPILQKMTQ